MSNPVDVTATTKTCDRRDDDRERAWHRHSTDTAGRFNQVIFPFNEGPSYKCEQFAVLQQMIAARPWAVRRECAEQHGAIAVRSMKCRWLELSDGSVLLNSRQFAGEKVRKSSVSHDGGVTWSPVEECRSFATILHGVDPSLFLCRYPAARSRILYSGPDDRNERMATLHLSYDEGKTWP